MRKIGELVRLKYEARLSHEQIVGALAISKGVVAKYVPRIEHTGPEPVALVSVHWSKSGAVDVANRRQRRDPITCWRAECRWCQNASRSA